MIESLQKRLGLPKPIAVLTIIVAFNIVLTTAWLLLNLKAAFFVLNVPSVVRGAVAVP